MAITPIGTVTTIAEVIDAIRERTNTISEEESELYRLPLTNLIHDALLLVRDKMDPRVIRDFYTTEPASVSEASNLVDISALDIYSMDVKDLVYYDASNGVAQMMTLDEFAGLKTIYSASMLTWFFIAYVANTGEKAQLRTFRGSSLVAPGALTLSYVRNPVKQTALTAKLDLPESMIRQVVEMVIPWIPARLKGAA